MNMKEGLALQPAAAPDGPFAVVDIGSNSLRLVVYDKPARAPVIVYNERSVIGLARGLGKTGKLPKAARARALATLERFVALARSMGSARVRMVATAAVREAADGERFIRDIRDRTGIDAEVMDAHREARLSALGLLAGLPEADGVLGDMGGGSMELADITGGRVRRDSSLPTGILRLVEESGANPERAGALIEERLGGIEWLADAAERPFYAIGGSWRAVARVMQQREAHPLPVIHGYTLKGGDLAERIGGLALVQQRKLPQTVPRHRRTGVRYAAAALAAVVRRTRPSAVVFSGYGLREGILAEAQGLRAVSSSPLLDGCATLGASRRAFVGDPATLAEWIAPVFTDDERHRLGPWFLPAAATLADIAWDQHPDHRARYAFERVALRALFPATQEMRVCLALAMHARYTSARLTGKARKIAGLVSRGRAARAMAVGCALRLAMTVSGGATATLDACRLRARDGGIELEVPRAVDGLVVRSRLKVLAKALVRKARVTLT